MATKELREIDRYVNLLKQEISKQDPVVLSVVVALAVVILTIVLFKIILGRKNTRRGVLLVGLCDSGKTLLFSKLTSGKYVMTQTSIKENSGTYKLQGEKKGVLKILDLPGHERLRNHKIDQFKDQARCIVFLVDSVTFQKDIKEVAELLYNLLSDQVISHNALPFLIACNKTDITTAKSSNVIKIQLEKEMNTLRITRSAALEGIDSSGSNKTYLGKKGKDFEFSHLKPIKVDFVECSARGAKSEESEGDISEIEKWLYQVS
ncbi:signal recognition particle receptor subunit beta-like [Saccoglossus kowalevskii]|uniref:Signal recognition particle receptor subunit beta n=1 Tax=Saccoglossus kowalevskii TaxID=10224 RepID=A0ABM0MSI1_SACKO|nr:PREDICTED: signal recognition particle receptor subunit beta-like [Saccoglossus kowalevskii]